MELVDNMRRYAYSIDSRDNILNQHHPIIQDCIPIPWKYKDGPKKLYWFYHESGILWRSSKYYWRNIEVFEVKKETFIVQDDHKRFN